MTDKVQKIREEIAKKLEVMQYQVHRKDAYKELKSVLAYIDSLQKEPVNEELEEAAMMHFKDAMEYEIKTGLKMAHMTSFKAGAKWQLNKIRNKYGKNRN